MKNMRFKAAALAAMLLTAACHSEQPAASTQQVAAGKVIYDARCAFCHGESGAGDTPIANGRLAANLADGKWVYGSTREEISSTIANGVPGTPMAGFGATLSPAEIESVTSYLLTLKR